MTYQKTASTLLISALAVNGLGCSSTPPKMPTESGTPFTAYVSPARGISSQATITDDENLDELFENFMKSPEPEVELQNYLSRQTDLYVKGFAFMREFDRSLDDALAAQSASNGATPAEPISSMPAYAKLMGLRTLSHRVSHRIRYFYGKLIYITATRNPNFKPTDFPDQASYEAAKIAFEERRVSARTILDKFNKNLHAGSKTESELQKLALTELHTEVLAEIHEFTSLRNKVREDSEEAVEDFNKALAKTLDEASFFSTLAAKEVGHFIAKNAKKIEKAGLKANEKIDLELQDQIRQADKELKFHTQTQAHDELSKRTPTAHENIHPDTGADGNLTGNTFPPYTWALTYDDGPSSIYTPRDLKNLAANNIKATFFWLTENVKRYPDVVKSVIDAGMPTETHSYTHPNMPTLSAAGWDKEIVKADAENAKAYGDDHSPTFFRLPYGAGMHVPGIRQRIADRHEVHVFWNVDTLDWQDHNPDSIFQRTIKEMKLLKHGIILFHDIHPQSVEASRMIMEWSKKENDAQTDPAKKIRWVTIPDIVKELNQ